MREFDFKVFNRNLQKDFQDASSIVSDIEHLELHKIYSLDYAPSHNYDHSEENTLNAERLADILKQIKLKLSFAFEYLDLKIMANSLTLISLKKIGVFEIQNHTIYGIS